MRPLPTSSPYLFYLLTVLALQGTPPAITPLPELPVVSPSDTRAPYRQRFDAEKLRQSAPSPTPFGLRVNHQKNPLGIDLAGRDYLRLSWKLPFVQAGNGEIKRGVSQSAYQIQVYTLYNGVHQNIWDSGKVVSSNQLLIPLQADLKSRTEYFWRVRIWDQDGVASDWSSASYFETGLLHQDDWQQGQKAEWITSNVLPEADDFITFWEDSALLALEYPRGKPSPDAPPPAFGSYADPDRAWEKAGSKFQQVKAPVYFRKTFNLSQKPTRARLYISGLGFNIAFLNGVLIGETQLGPNFVHYDLRALYNTYDVTADLTDGENCIGVIVAPGRYYEAPGGLMWPAICYGQTPILIVRLEAEMPDGSVEVVTTDLDWEVGSGGYRRTSFWIGEAFDATKEPTGWDTVDFEQDWETAQPVNSPPPLLQADQAEPIQANFVLKPVARYNPIPGVWVYDFGKMVTGRASVRFDLPAGTQVRIRYADTLCENPEAGGILFQDYDTEVLFSNCQKLPLARHRGTAALFEELELANGQEAERLVIGAADAFKSNGEPCTYMASFCYNGFRYIEISTLPDGPSLDDVEAVGIYSSLEPVGELMIEDPFLQRIHDACVNSIIMNMLGLYQDNPGAEKLGGNAITPLCFYDVAQYTANHARQLEKSIEDNRILALETGMPNPVTLTRRGIVDLQERISRGFLKVNNNAHHVGVPLRQYIYYGDSQIAEENMEVAQLYFDYFFRTDVDIRWGELFPRGTSTHLDWTSARDVPGGPWGPPWGDNKQPSSEAFGRVGNLLYQADEFQTLCRLIGYDEVWEDYEHMVEDYKDEAFDRFYDFESERFDRPREITQETDIFTIKSGLVDEDVSQALVDDIVINMHEQTLGHQVVSVKSPYWYLQLLSRFGYHEEALRLLHRDTYPSIGGMLTVTGWSVAEGWGFPGFPADNSFIQAEGVAGVGNWFYNELVGIQPDMEHPGFQRFYLDPVVSASSPDYDFAYNSPRGLIASRYSREDDRIEWAITVPPNSETVVSLPVGQASDWTEGGLPLPNAAGVSMGGPVRSDIQFPKQTPDTLGKSRVTLSSGVYHLLYQQPVSTGDHPE